MLEAADHVGGGLGGDRVDCFLLDEGADFMTASHDLALRLCDALGRTSSGIRAQLIKIRFQINEL